MSFAISSYPKIWGMSHREASEIFADEVEITEKVDGSQLSITVIDGELFMRSKGQQINIECPDNLFIAGVEMAKSKILEFKNGWTYRGEYLRAPRHNTLKYSRCPKNHFIVFNIDKSEENYLSYEEMTEEAKRLDFEVVPLIFRGKTTLAEVKEMMNRESILGGEMIEGVVVKNYNKYSLGSKTLMGKLVRESFKESNGKNWKITTKKDIIQQIVDCLKTTARFEKAIFHARDNGLLNGELSDIPVLFKEINKDILEEESGFIKDKLFEWAIKNIIKETSRGLPEYYKEFLTKENFGE